MKFKPSAIDKFLSTLPEDLQILALQAIKEESDRWIYGNLTENERTILKSIYDTNANLAQTIDKIVMQCITSN